jgi:hypothetical protein
MISKGEEYVPRLLILDIASDHLVRGRNQRQPMKMKRLKTHKNFLRKWLEFLQRYLATPKTLLNSSQAGCN